MSVDTTIWIPAAVSLEWLSAQLCELALLLDPPPLVASSDRTAAGDSHSWWVVDCQEASVLLRMGPPVTHGTFHKSGGVVVDVSVFRRNVASFLLLAWATYVLSKMEDAIVLDEGLFGPGEQRNSGELARILEPLAGMTLEEASTSVATSAGMSFGREG